MRKQKSNNISLNISTEAEREKILSTNILSIPLPVLIILKDKFNRYILFDFNDRAQEIFNLPFERIKGKELRLFWDRETWDDLRKGLTKAIRKDEYAVIETMHITKDGKEKSYRLTIWSFSDNLACVCFVETIDKYLFTQSVLSEKLKYEELFKNTPVMMIMMDRHGKILDVNSYWCEKTGYEKHELLGHSLVDYFSDETKKYLSAEQLESRIISNELIDYPVQILRKGGNYLTCVSTARTLFDINGVFIRCYFVAHDISALKEITEEYESIDKLLQTLFKNVNSAIILYSNQMGIINCNSQTENLLKSTKDDLIGKKLFEVIKFNDQKGIELISKIDELIEKGDFEISLNVLIGEEKKIIELISRKVFLKGKSILVLILHDKSKEKMKDQMIEETEFKFRILFEESSEPIKIHNFDGKILMMNNKALELFEGLIDDHNYLKIKNKKFDYTKRLINFICSNESKTEIEYTIKTKDNLRIIRERNIKLNLGNNKALVLSTINDLTENRKIEIEQRRKEEYLTKLNESKNKLLYILSHDLRAPSASIIGIANAILEQPHINSEEIYSYVKLIRSAASHQLDLINNLLDWSLLESGKLNYSLRPINLSYAIYNSINSIHGLAREKNIKIKVNVKPAFVLIDLNLFSRIMINILSNALKFSYPNSKIEVYSKVAGTSNLRIFVRDFGIGFDEETQANIFQFHGRVSKTGTKGEKGSGLGLILCNDILKILGTHLEIKSPLNKKSKKNRGSEVSFEVPIVESTVYISNSAKNFIHLNTLEKNFKKFSFIVRNFNKYLKNLLIKYHLLSIIHKEELDDSFITKHLQKFNTIGNILILGDSPKLRKDIKKIPLDEITLESISKELQKIEFDMEQQISSVNQLKKMLQL